MFLIGPNNKIPFTKELDKKLIDVSENITEKNGIGEIIVQMRKHIPIMREIENHLEIGTYDLIHRTDNSTGDREEIEE